MHDRRAIASACSGWAHLPPPPLCQRRKKNGCERGGGRWSRGGWNDLRRESRREGANCNPKKHAGFMFSAWSKAWLCDPPKPLREAGEKEAGDLLNSSAIKIWRFGGARRGPRLRPHAQRRGCFAQLQMEIWDVLVGGNMNCLPAVVLAADVWK